MELKKFLKSKEEFKISEIDCNTNCIEEKFTNESFSHEDNFISIIDKKGDEFSIEFKLDVSWDVSNSGDGVITPYESFAEDIEVEIDVVNVEDYDNDIQVELNDRESISELESWITEKLDIT